MPPNVKKLPMYRLLSMFAVALLLASPASATILVQEGDSYDVLEVTSQEDFLMTGGSVNRLVLDGGFPAVIEGGLIGANNDDVAIEVGDSPLTIRGGMIRTTGLSPYSPATIFDKFHEGVDLFEGTQFRASHTELGGDEGGFWIIQGWLADGNFLNVYLYHDGPVQLYDLEFAFTPDEPPVTPGDTNEDGAVDLNDLNDVRNNFDGTGSGDANGDGIVNLEDLNLVRNNFGVGPFFTLGPEHEVPRPAPVPEPSAFLLACIACCLQIASRRLFLGSEQLL